MKVLSLAALFAIVFILTDMSHVFAQQLITQRQIALLEKARRPGDPWPRGDGHILLAEPGSPLTQKGYHEPGGSFSPSPGSFGISIWIYDATHKLVATGDDIPMDSIRQAYVYGNGAILPSIQTETPYYTCTWSYRQPGKWELSFRVADTASFQAVLVVRSVGPAGGPLLSAIWDQTRLMLNHRWLITPSFSPSPVIMGDETTGGLLKVLPPKDAVTSESGWAFARMDLPGQASSVEVVDTKPQFGSLLSYDQPVQHFEVELPDSQFTRSLQAQVANLMMGYVGRQTGPGEPINYPLAWERDGAYSLAAMARSGHLQTAKELSVYFAENDFFGGFGAEGDAAGSAINALTELAFLVDDAAYYQWVWPHIRRKLAIIDEMMNATADVYKNYTGPLAPHLENDTRRRQLICRKAEDGLIIGTMDGHFPVLYINAISYRGLVQASRLADHFADTLLAAQCRQKAALIKRAWTKGFGKPKYDNERNFMISIWPSWITDKDNALFKEKITAKHEAEWAGDPAPKERPLWTYFTVAEAHQWLFLGRPDLTWKTLHYFWQHQSSPGLYSYWEGNGEENTFRQWENYRGWLQPKYVTPHYWTASEMVLLQLDMLVYIDESQQDYEFVIGAGIPGEWLKKDMSVKNYRTKAGIVSWEYKQQTLSVTIKNARHKYSVRAGTAFADAGTRLKVRYQ